MLSQVVLLTELQQRKIPEKFGDFRYTLFFAEIFYYLPCGTGHFYAEITVPFAGTELFNPVGKICFVFNFLSFGKHFAHFVRLLNIVCILINNFFYFKTRRFLTGYLSFCGITKADHTARHNVCRKVENLFMLFETFYNIADITTAYCKLSKSQKSRKSPG